jgi:hypothetical protein
MREGAILHAMPVDSPLGHSYLPVVGTHPS